MRIRLTHIVCYLIIFTFISICIMIYSLHTIAGPVIYNVHGNAAIIQDMLCKGIRVVATATSTKKRKTTEATTTTTTTTTATVQRQIIQKLPDFRNVREVLMSLKNDIFVNTTIYNPSVEIYDNHAKLKTFNRNFSLYNNQDFKLLRELFPVREMRNRPHEDRIETQMSVGLKSTAPKVILVYNHDDNLRTEVLQQSQCKVSNCLFTTEKKDIVRADAVIFRYISERVRRPANKSDQVWIYSQLESAASIRTAHKNKELVNWTATYRSDSVLNTPYAKFKPFDNITQLPLSSRFNYAQGKTKLSAWFVSNCGAPNGRMDYVLQLKKFARVDMYGMCGPLKCTRLSNGNCFEMLKKEYKFYLAFENSNCRDYITEKFFLNALQ